MKGVRIVVVGIGPDARKPKHRRVLEFIGGKNVFYVSDYASLEDATSDIINLICRKYKMASFYLGPFYYVHGTKLT